MIASHNATAAQELAACRTAYGRGDLQACDMHGSRVLTLAGDDPLLVAHVCYLKGNVEERRGREGLAMRTWAIGLEQLERAGLTAEPLHLLLHESIENLRLAPRVLLSYAPADLPLALWLGKELLANGFDAYRGEPPAEVVVCDLVMEALDRSACVLVLWSHGYRSRPHCVSELVAARARLEGWRSLTAAPRLVLLQLADGPVPEPIADLPWVDVRRGLDGDAVRALRAAVGMDDGERHPGAGTAAPSYAAGAHSTELTVTVARGSQPFALGRWWGSRPRRSPVRG